MSSYENSFRRHAPDPSSVEEHSLVTGIFRPKVISLAGYRDLPSEVQAQVAMEFGEALKLDGIVAVPAPELVELSKRLYAAAKDFFALPIEEKVGEQAHINRANLSESKSGYTPLETERRPDGGMFEAHEDLLYFPQKMKLLPQYPEVDPVVREVHALLQGYGEACYEVMFAGLGVAEECEERSIAPTESSVLRVAHYLSRDSIATPLEETVWLYEHKDTSPIAIYLPAESEGLQVKVDGEWRDLLVPDDCIVLNTGFTLERITAGLIRPVEHRVLMPGEDQLKRDRLSITFFMNFADDFDMTPLTECFAGFKDRVERGLISAERIAEIEQLLTPTGTFQDFIKAEGLRRQQITRHSTEEEKAAIRETLRELLAKGHLTDLFPEGL